MWLHLLATSSALSLPLPTPEQLAFHEQGSTQFTHFSVCTFAGCEQNSPALPASTFNPTSRVDTDQWVRVAQLWGAKQICITAHHSGGFALWQTNFTNYGLKESPYLNGTADIVRDFVASCRAAGVSPCFYIIPGWNAWENTRFATNSTLYVQAELNMIRELLTNYGHIDRIWFDFYGMACGQYGAQCPKGSFPEAWQTINQLVASVSPGTTLSMPGTDGCLLAGADGNPEIGSGAYPSWYYNKRFGTYGWGSRNPIVCEPTEPVPATQTLSPHVSYPKADMYWATHEADHTILNPGDHWFWRSDHPHLPASALWQHWLDTVGRGSSYILNVPPDTSGKIPDSFVQELSLLGAALNASFSTPVVSAGVSGVGVVGVGAMAADIAFGANDPPVTLLCGEDPGGQSTTRGASALVHLVWQ